MITTNTITMDEANRIRAFVTEHEAWVTNEQRSQLEVYDFMHTPPERYFAYYKGNAERGQSITTWTGDILGVVVDCGAVFTSNFGDKRRHVTIRAINGRTYKGVAQLSNGTYVRMRASKA